VGNYKVIEGFADSPHKFGVVVTSRQWGKSLLAQNLLLYWLLSNPGQKGAWIAPIYNQCKKVFNELNNAANAIITKQNKADLTIEF
jgi:phage terminase large subunit-like protein